MIIDIRCPNCGSNLKVKSDNDSYMCLYCNSQFVIQDVFKVNKDKNVQITNATKEDKKLFNEVDKYIANFNIGEFERLQRIIYVLKEYYPHKGIARIIILHYQFQTFFKFNSYEKFCNESKNLKMKVENYNPKSYKEPPPYTDFLKDMQIIEIKYASEIENLLTELETSRYEKICSYVLNLIHHYYVILDYNKKLNEKFLPFKEKYLKKNKK